MIFECCSNNTYGVEFSSSMMGVIIHMVFSNMTGPYMILCLGFWLSGLGHSAYDQMVACSNPRSGG